MKKTAAQLWLNKLKFATGRDHERELVLLVKRMEGEVLGEMSDFCMWRERAEKCMKNDFSWRRDNLRSNIYNLSNETLGQVRSGAGFLVARLVDDIWGSEPWMAATPEPDSGISANDEVDLQAHAEKKLRECGFQSAGENAVDRVINFGETILRAGWKKDVQAWSSLRTVMVDSKGKPVLTSTGDYIYNTDKTVQIPSGPAPVENEQAEGEQPTGEEQAEQPMITVAEKDNSTVIPEGARWDEMLVEEKRTVCDRPDVQVISWRDFRCSPSYAKIENAPFRCHINECLLSELRLRLEEQVGASYAQWDDETKAMFDALKTDSTAPKTGARSEGGNPAGSGGDEKNPTIKCIDFEIEWDPEGNGATRSIIGTVLVETERLFFVEFMQNVLEDVETLYSVVSAYNPVDCWHGRGWWQLFQDVTANLDRLWNNLLEQDSRISNPVTGVNYRALDMSIQEVGEVRAGVQLALKDNKKIEDAYSYSVYPNTQQGRHELLQIMLQMNQLEGGVSNAAQGDLSTLPSTATATGTNSVLASGSVLHKLPAKKIREGLEQTVEKILALAYAMQTETECVTCGKGDKMRKATISPELVKNLAMRVQFTMTRFHQREVLEQTDKAMVLVNWYLTLPESEKQAVRPMIIHDLKQLSDVPNPDQVIREPIPPQPAAPPAPPFTERLNTSFKDLPPTAKLKALAGMGFDVPPQEVQEPAEPKPNGAKPEPATE